MKSSRLIRSLEALNRQELSDFRDFTHSPFFNKNSKAGEMVDFLWANRDSWTIEVLDIDKVADELFPGVRLQKQRIRDHMSLVLDLLKKFLIQCDLKANPRQQDLMLLRQFRQRSLGNGYLQLYQNIKEELEESPYRNEEHFFDFYQLSVEEEASFSLKGSRENSGNLLEMDQYLDRFYLSRKLGHLCEMRNRETILNVKYEHHFGQVISELLQDHRYNYLQVPSIRVQHQILQMLSNPEEPDHYKQLLKLLDLYGDEFTSTELSAFFDHAQNYCIRRINQGNASFLKEIFAVYKQMLGNARLGLSESIPHAHYKNMVTVGLRLEAFDWVKNFIEDYKDSLSKDIRENAYQYSLASYYYNIGAHDLMTSLLVQAKFSDIYYEMGAKYLLIKGYYENEELSPLQYLLISFERLLGRRKELSVQRRNAELNFIRILKKVVKLREQITFKPQSYIEEQRKKLLATLETKKPLVNTKWLREQVLALK